jgi:hypothetical protein
MNFKYLIDNNISLYCESEEDNLLFISLCRENGYIIYSHPECDFYKYSRNNDCFDCYLLNPQVEKCITFTDWKNIGVNDMEIEVGKKYIDNDNNVIKIGEIKGNLIFNDKGFQICTVGSGYYKTLKPYTESTEINLETHIGKVNDDRLYEFSDDDTDDNWILGYLHCILDNNNNSEFKYLCSSKNNAIGDIYRHCRLYKEPEEKVYMSHDEIYQFCNDSKKVIYVKNGDDFIPNWLKVLDTTDLWTTIDDKTKEYNEPKEFLRRYLDE